MKMENNTQTDGKTSTESIGVTEMQKTTGTKIGICKNCEDEYDSPTETKLYLVSGRWLCGDCADEWEHEKAENLLAYGDD